MNHPNELAVFAGSGGGLLASHLLGWRTVCAVEYSPYCASVLVARQNDGSLPAFPVWDNVRTFDGRPWRGRVNIVSGGFPCQAFSNAAHGENTAENLWPEQLRVVADVAPEAVFAENVTRDAIDAAADDLEQMGYVSRCCEVSAADLGADHLRRRFWLCAYADPDCELRRSIHAKMAVVPQFRNSLWSAFSGESRVSDGMANRMDRLAATGNGQVPAVAAAAFLYLSTQF